MPLRKITNWKMIREMFRRCYPQRFETEVEVEATALA
jgi:hypothetical protein